MNPLVAVMTRVPLPGQTKTRLMTHLSGEECAKLQQAFLEDLIVLLTEDVRLPAGLFFAPPEHQQLIENIVDGRLPCWPQAGENLGERLEFVVRNGFEQGFQAVIVIGSDSPMLQASLFEETVNLLKDHDIVLGPAEDGGYYLVAMKSYHPEVFSRISWGTELVFSQTVERIAEQGLTVTLLSYGNDIDTFDDLLALHQQLHRAIEEGQLYPRQTYKTTAELFATPDRSKKV